MANHKSAKKRIRANESKRSRNRVQKNTMKNVVKKLRLNKDKKSATEQLTKVFSLLDKLKKNNVLHKNNAANMKSKLTKHVNALK